MKNNKSGNTAFASLMLQLGFGPLPKGTNPKKVRKPCPRPSKLDPYGEEILELFDNGVSYREMVKILSDRVSISVSRLHNFVERCVGKKSGVLK